MTKITRRETPDERAAMTNPPHISIPFLSDMPHVDSIDTSLTSPREKRLTNAPSHHNKNKNI